MCVKYTDCDGVFEVVSCRIIEGVQVDENGTPVKPPNPDDAVDWITIKLVRSKPMVRSAVNSLIGKMVKLQYREPTRREFIERVICGVRAGRSAAKRADGSDASDIPDDELRDLLDHRGGYTVEIES
jgi:hypothetical protein